MSIPQNSKAIPSYFPYALGLEWFFYTFFLGLAGVFLWLCYYSFGMSLAGWIFLVPGTLIALYLLYQWGAQTVIFLLKIFRNEKFGVWIEEDALMVRMHPRKARRLRKEDVKSCERKTFMVSQDLPLTQKETISLIHLKSGEILKISDLKIDDGHWLKEAIDEWRK